MDDEGMEVTLFRHVDTEGTAKTANDARQRPPNDIKKIR